MPTLFKRYVEPGRLALITYGPCEGKMCTIIDIISQRRVIVDGPVDLTGVQRHQMPVGRLSLTDFKCKISRAAKQKTLRKALAADETLEKWAKTSWARKLAAQKTRANLNDFERHQLFVARKRRMRAAKSVLNPKLKISKKWL